MAMPKVKIDNFEGPFDLLLELAQAKKVDLKAILLGGITDDYLQFIRGGRVEAEASADFLLVASTLLLLKLRAVLPGLKPEEEEEAADFAERLKIYQAYRQRAMLIREGWALKQLLPGRPLIDKYFKAPPPDISMTELRAAMRRLLETVKAPEKATRHLRGQGRGLKECLDLITGRLQRLKEAKFHELVSEEDNQTKAMSLLALLEMTRQQRVNMAQEYLFDDIIIRTQTYDSGSSKN